MHHLLLYDYVEDILERRAPHREEHLALAREYVDRGELILGGALKDPTDGAVLAFETDDPASVEAFVERDPYVRNGLVTRWRIRAWNVVIGSAL